MSESKRKNTANAMVSRACSHANSPFKLSNPFGGRRMIFDDIEEVKDRRDMIGGPGLEKAENHDLKRMIGMKTANKNKICESPLPTEAGRRSTFCQLSESSVEKESNRVKSTCTEDHDKSDHYNIRRSCGGGCKNTGAETVGLRRGDVEQQSPYHREGEVIEPGITHHSKVHKQTGRNHTAERCNKQAETVRSTTKPNSDFKVTESNLSLLDSHRTKNQCRDILKSKAACDSNCPISPGQIPNERYKILFTNELAEDNYPLRPGISPTLDKLAGGDNNIPLSLSKSKTDITDDASKTTPRKFLIRREKHEAADGKDENATYTIHVCSQAIREAYNSDTIVNPKTAGSSKKKETRGAIFRQSILKSNCAWNYYEPDKTKISCDNGSRLQDRNIAAHRDKNVMPRMSSSSPPKRKKEEDLSFRQPRAQCKVKKNACVLKKRRPIRLIDHLEKKEQMQLDTDHKSAQATPDMGETHVPPNPHGACATMRRSKADSSSELANTQNHEPCLSSVVSGTPKESCKLSFDHPLRQRDSTPAPLHERENDCCTQHDPDKKPSYTPFIDSPLETSECPPGLIEETKPHEIKEADSKIISIPLTRDVACQYSPPVDLTDQSQPCCPCHCHLKRIKASLDDVSHNQENKTADLVSMHSPSENKNVSNYFRDTEKTKPQNSVLTSERMGNAYKEHNRAIAPTEKILEVRGEDVDKTYGIQNQEKLNDEQSMHVHGISRNASFPCRKVGGSEHETVCEGPQEHGRFLKTQIPLMRLIKERKVGAGKEMAEYKSSEEDEGDEDKSNDDSDKSQQSGNSTTDNSTPIQNVCKNNSATKKAAPGTTKATAGKAPYSGNAGNTFRSIVDKAKQKSNINVSKLDKNSSYQKVQEVAQEDSGHFFIGDYLLSLWKKQVLCDVRVNVNNTHFLAHKLVLAAFSDVFTPITPYPEPTLQFTVPNASPDAVYKVFKYIYTATMDVKDDQLEDILHVGIFLGISEIKDVVLEILSKPNLENVELYIDIQNRCGIPASLMDYPQLYRVGLIHMTQLEKFLQLTPEELEGILRDPDVLVESEVDTLHALASWAQYNPLERVPEISRLLDFIIFEVISPDLIARITQLYDPIFAEIGARNKIAEVFRFHALQLASKVGHDESFVRDVPGIAQDEYLDRVSYIPSQNTLSQYQSSRPSLSKPNLRKTYSPMRNTMRYNVRPSIKSHSSSPLICKTTKSIVPPDRSSIRSQKRSFNFSQNKVNAKKKGKPMVANRSNNSILNTNGKVFSSEDKDHNGHSTGMIENTDGAPRNGIISRKSRAEQPKGSISGDSSMRLVGERNGRFPRKDHWRRVPQRNGIAQHSPKRLDGTNAASERCAASCNDEKDSRHSARESNQHPEHSLHNGDPHPQHSLHNGDPHRQHSLHNGHQHRQHSLHNGHQHRQHSLHNSHHRNRLHHREISQPGSKTTSSRHHSCPCEECERCEKAASETHENFPTSKDFLIDFSAPVKLNVGNQFQFPGALENSNSNASSIFRLV